MKVAMFLTGKLDLNRSMGDTVRNIELAFNLEKCGCEVTLVAPMGDYHKMKMMVSHIREYVTVKNFSLPGVLAHLYPIRRLHYSLVPPEVLRTEDFDIVQFEGEPYILPLTPIDSLASKLPLVCDMHSIGAIDVLSMAKFPRPLDSFVFALLWSLQYRLIEKSRGVIVVSNKMRQFIESFDVASNKLQVIPNGVNIGLSKKAMKHFAWKYDWIRSKGSPIIAYVGALEWVEGVDVLVTAVSKLMQTHRKAMLIIAGGGSCEKVIKTMVRDLDLDDKVLFLGIIPYEETFALQNSADILVAPLRRKHIYDISLPSKIPNYLATGKPIIASSAGDIPMILENMVDVLLVPPGDPEALEHTLFLLAEDATLRKRLSVAARHKAMEFDWGSLAVRLVEFYRQLLES